MGAQRWIARGGELRPWLRVVLRGSGVGSNVANDVQPAVTAALVVDVSRAPSTVKVARSAIAGREHHSTQEAPMSVHPFEPSGGHGPGTLE
jgi:hypothetical protein